MYWTPIAAGGTLLGAVLGEVFYVPRSPRLKSAFVTGGCSFESERARF